MFALAARSARRLRRGVGTGSIAATALALRLLARQLSGATDRLRLFPGFALRRLFIGAPLLDLPKYAFALHFLFQNTESLIDIVVADKNLQLMFLRVQKALRQRDEGANYDGRCDLVTQS